MRLAILLYYLNYYFDWLEFIKYVKSFVLNKELFNCLLILISKNAYTS